MKKIQKNSFTRIIESRVIQSIINEYIRKKKFNIPIHLSLGHECLSEAISLNIKKNDKLICSHRNLHYQIARDKNLKKILNEFSLLTKDGSSGNYGSMNLINPTKGIIYTSSILGNNLSVACGVSYSLKKTNNITFVITGDGAIEEGAFYEALLISKSLNLPIIIIIENNEWSLASKINERRCKINFKKLCSSLDIEYDYLSKNNIENYYKKINFNKQKCLSHLSPVVIEVKLNTLGYRYEKQNNKLKYINYHAGLAQTTSLERLIIEKNNNDPLYVIETIIGKKLFNELKNKIIKKYSNEISKIY